MVNRKIESTFWITIQRCIRRQSDLKKKKKVTVGNLAVILMRPKTRIVKKKFPCDYNSFYLSPYKAPAIVSILNFHQGILLFWLFLFFFIHFSIFLVVTGRSYCFQYTVELSQILGFPCSCSSCWYYEQEKILWIFTLALGLKWNSFLFLLCCCL